MMNHRNATRSRSQALDAVELARESIARTRREFLLNSGCGLGSLAAVSMAGLLSSDGVRAAAAPAAAGLSQGILPAAHLPARARRVVYLHMLGAISQVDTFDYKPKLESMGGQELPPSVRGTARLSTMVAGQSSFPIVAPLRKFRQYGQSGAWVSDLMPFTGRIVDELCFIKTVHTEHVNHDPASKFLHTGFQLAGRPSAGAWVSYALGSDNVDLPNYVVMTSGMANGVPLDAAAWGAGFLPSHFQGVQLRPGASPVPYIANPDGVSRADRRRLLDVVAALADQQHKRSGDPEIPSKLSQYEMAYRMQQSVPELVDLRDEPQHVLDLYGPDVQVPGSFARNCLLARRLIERDVKYVQMFHMGWDHHINIAGLHPFTCKQADQPAAGLVRDLKQRGLLDDTLVLFGSEFGRTSFAQGAQNGAPGRDHHGGNCTWWLAGAGVRAGHSYGETDDFSYNIVKDPVSVYDLNATLLHILGIEHQRLTYRSQGRDFRLTDVHGEVIRGVLS
jgi:hypothetical protein